MNSGTSKLLLLVSSAFFARVFLIWIGRPEFVGWFNHTYYYYVETLGLMSNGKLPFPDMPLLFHLYANTARLIGWFGVETKIAIVHSTRFWMCLIPSLIPIPVYLVFKSMYKEESFPKWIWALLFASAFYPLTLVHLPEFLQKNTLGLFLLAVFILQSKTALEGLNLKVMLSLAFTFILILLTHYGSAAVALLYILAFLISLWLHNRKTGALWLILGLLVGFAVSVWAFYTLDYQRFIRISSYMSRIMSNSSLGLLFSADDPDKFSTVFMLIVPLGFVALLYYGYWRSKTWITSENSVFWFGNILFSYFLLLPIYEPLLLARFVNFLSLPMIFIVAYTLQHTIRSVLWKRVLVAFAILGPITMVTGEITSLKLHNRNKEGSYADLLIMKDKMGFGEEDLIITRNGAEHVANWFLNTKSTLITSFNTNDLKKYERVFIMNPVEGSMRLQSSSNQDVQKYNYMLSNITVPEEAKPVYESAYIHLFLLESVPKAWTYNEEGNWKGY